MHKLWATIQKDVRILTRDKVGLIFMFGLPIILVVIVTSIQNSAFEVVNANKVPLLICNRDTGAVGKRFVEAIDQVGIFRLVTVPPTESDAGFAARVHAKEALVGLVVPADFSARLQSSAHTVAGKALHSFGMDSTGGAAVPTGAPASGAPDPVSIYEHPVLQESFRRSVRGAVGGAIQLLASKLVLQEVYRSINDKPLSDSLSNSLLASTLDIREIPVSKDRTLGTPNAAQHNVPAWTIFAMFFVVLSLGSSVVREKINGSFVRLKTLPTSYMVALLSKQLTYLTVTLVQTALIFAVGIVVFPWVGLPALHLPPDILGLVLVTLICGWCAVSYAICVGVFARTQEQSNGFGAISVIILAVIGGLMVPSFVMPDAMKAFMNISPLHWCLEAYYGLFLEGGQLRDVWVNIIPLLAITVLIQGVTLWGLKNKNLI